MKKLTALVLIVIGLVAIDLWPAKRPLVLHGTGTVVVTTTEVRSRSERFTRYSVAWTSTAGGAVDTNPFSTVAGRLEQVRFIPGTGGTQPTAAYDVAIVDNTNPIVANLLSANTVTGTDLSNANTVISRFSDPALFLDGSHTIDIQITNAGASKTGTIELFIKTSS